MVEEMTDSIEQNGVPEFKYRQIKDKHIQMSELPYISTNTLTDNYVAEELVVDTVSVDAIVATLILGSWAGEYHSVDNFKKHGLSYVESMQ